MILHLDKEHLTAYAHWVFMQTLNLAFAVLMYEGMYRFGVEWDASLWIKIPVSIVVFGAAFWLYVRLAAPIWDKNDALMKRAKEALNKDDDHFPIG